MSCKIREVQILLTYTSCGIIFACKKPVQGDKKKDTRHISSQGNILCSTGGTVFISVHISRSNEHIVKCHCWCSVWTAKYL